MFLIKSNEGALQNSDLAFFGGPSDGLIPAGQRILASLLGEEKPRDMAVLLTILVALLHVWMLIWLMRPEEKVTQAVPLVMDVSMITIQAPKPAAAPPKPSPPPPPPPEKKPTPPKKPKPNPVAKKPAPVVQKAPDFAPVEQLEPPPPPPTASSESSNTSSTASATSTAAPTTNAETFTEANYKANYAHNPKPEYPTIAKSRGWQGKVLLRVKVSAEGLSDDVAVEQSSGHEILDESAVETVKKWRFIPAKRGETAVASSVIVPIVFTLRN